MSRGQANGAGIVAFFVVVFAFIIFFALGGYQLTNLAGQMAITSGNLTGLEAFFFGNLSLWVILGLVVSVVVVSAWGLRR
jgi:hypothetical protein